MTFRMSVTHAVQLIAACSVIGFTVWAWLCKCDRRKKKNRLFLRQKTSIHMVCKPEEWEIISPQFHREVKEMKVIGLDCEWVLERKVALLQLSTDTGMCVLLRMHLIGLEIPNSLRRLLSDKSILKVGVAVNDDAKRLLHDHSLAVCGCVDLRHILHRVRGIYHCRSWGLQGLAQAVLDVSITKDPSVRCGDWEAPVLSSEQMEYAAADAMVAVEIFRHLVLAKLLGADPRLNQDAAQNVSKDMFWSCARSLCQGITDLSYIRFHTSAQSFHGKSPQDLDKKWSGKAYTARKRPLWDNCRLLAPDGQLLCTCDFRKATWYIDKDLGKKVCDNPLTVELNFEPSNRPASDRNYYLQDKENMCVVCGAREGYIRKFIISQEYRKYFPAAFKDHSSHDVLLMCPPCHKRSSDFDTELRLQLVQQCNAPLDSGSNSHVLQDRDLQDVRSAARALKKSKSQIPEERVQQLERILLGFYGVPSLTPELLETAANIDIKVTRGKVMKHGEKVVRYMMEHGGGLLEFQKLWRHHFLRTMQPEWLPPLWSVDHTEERQRRVDAVMSTRVVACLAELSRLSLCPAPSRDAEPICKVPRGRERTPDCGDRSEFAGRGKETCNGFQILMLVQSASILNGLSWQATGRHLTALTSICATRSPTLLCRTCTANARPCAARAPSTRQQWRLWIKSSSANVTPLSFGQKVIPTKTGDCHCAGCGPS